MLGHAVHDPARAGDQAVAAFFLDAGQAGEELVGDVLAQAFLAEGRARDVEALAALQLLAAGIEVLQLERRHFNVMDLAEVVIQARDFEPLRLRRDHAPAGQVVERRAPQHRLLATGIHGDVAADAARLGRGRIDREHITRAIGCIGHALRDDASLAEDSGHRLRHARQRHHLDLAHRFQLFGIDDGALPRQRHRAAGVAGATAARDDRQFQLDAAGDQRRHLGLRVRRQHDKRHLDAPVRSVGDMRNAAQAVELDVVLGRRAAEHAARGFAQIPHRAEMRGKSFDRSTRRSEQLADQRIALRIGLRRAPFFDLVQPVVQRIDQRGAPLRVVEQVVFEVRVALHDPDVAQHLVQHARRTARATLVAQLVEQRPGARTEQAHHDLAVRERGVVVGNLAQPLQMGRVVLVVCQRLAGLLGQGCIHRVVPMLPCRRNDPFRTRWPRGLPPLSGQCLP